ncbi:MAG: GNAT family protein [Ferruginibacter sp.]
MIELSYFDRNDFEQLKEWITDEELLMNWSGSLFTYPLTDKSLDWYLEDVNIKPKSNAYLYKAIDTFTGRVVGHISLGGISKKNKSGRISRVLVGNSADRGKGYCHQMVSAILKIGFEDLKLHRISLGVYSFNTSALKCYQRVGFSIEGTQREVLSFKGNWWSLVEMSILNREWQEIKKKE